MSSSAAAEFAGVIGLTGKIPTKADFVHLRLPGLFTRPWEEWVEAVMRLGAADDTHDWQRRFLVSPAWRFALDAGCLGPPWWAGVLVPCSDSIGRIYPLTVAAGGESGGPLGDDVLAVFEDVALELVDGAIEPEGAADRLSDCVKRRLPPPADQPSHAWHDAAGGPVLLRLGDAAAADLSAEPPVSRFWHRAWGDQPALQLTASGLPPPQAFISLVDGTWPRRDWIRLAGERR
ncbi:MAG: type VI secretion system-associated protein TagF [Ancalomicrobiaceae bacterium]|nr:type VI secretion system-associated protein TagF [Ancalomicrobiaceae bacterium]